MPWDSLNAKNFIKKALYMNFLKDYLEGQQKYYDTYKNYTVNKMKLKYDLTKEFNTAQKSLRYYNLNGIEITIYVRL